MSIKTYQMAFNGEVLERGFWLYVCEIISDDKKHIYIGRTGDSSSPNASSPFSRIGQHLDFRENAKGNSLAKHLTQVGVNPKSSQFRMLALGPFFPEQESFHNHKPYRDQMATFEHELASHLVANGFVVLGVHHKGAPVNEKLLGEVKSKVLGFLGAESS